MTVRLDHIRLDVDDIGRAEAFYRDAIGFAPVVRYDLPDRAILQMGPNGAPPGVELWRQRGQVANPHPTHHLALSVTAVAPMVARIAELGYRVVEEPFRIGDETIAFVADPDGHLIELNDFRGRHLPVGPAIASR